MIIYKKVSIPYLADRTINQTLLIQLFRLTPGVCTHKISLHNLIHYLSVQAVAHHLTTIK